MTMNEKELAQWFETRRGDTSFWSETPAKAHVRRGGTIVFSLRFSPEELDVLRQRAQEWGTTISHLIRSAVLEAVDRPSWVRVLTIDQVQHLTPPATFRVSYEAAFAGYATWDPDDPFGCYILGLPDSPYSSSAPLPAGV